MATTEKIEPTAMAETEITLTNGFLLVGQERWRRRVYRLAQSPRRGHAHLLAGPPGVGTDSLALHFATALLCPNTDENGPCWNCSTCQGLMRLEHPRLHLVFPLPRKGSDENDPLQGFPEKLMETIHQELSLKATNPYHTLNIPGANEIRIASIRHLRRQLLVQAGRQERQVAVIFQAETMNGPAFNALLKILEEPPANTFFILTSSGTAQLPATILSRCQQHKIPPVSERALVNYLQQTREAKEDEIFTWVRLAQGNVETAQLLAEQGSEILTKEIDSWVDALTAGELSTAIKLTRQFHRRSVESQLMERWLSLFMLFFREVMAPTGDPLPHWAQPVKKMRQTYPHADWPAIIKKIDKTREAINRKVYLPLAMADLLLSVLEMLQAGKTQDN